MTTPATTSVPPTLRELCATATPGPWYADPCSDGERTFIVGDNMKAVIAATRPEGIIQRIPHPQATANAQLIARFSPQVALAVYDALQLDLREANNQAEFLPSLRAKGDAKIREAVFRKTLDLLDGKESPQ